MRQLESAEAPKPGPSTSYAAPRAPVPSSSRSSSSSRPSQRLIDNALSTLRAPAANRDEPYIPPTRGGFSYGRAPDPATDLDALCASPAFRKEVQQLKSAQDDLELSLVDQRNRIIADADRRLKGLASGYDSLIRVGR